MSKRVFLISGLLTTLSKFLIDGIEAQRHMTTVACIFYATYAILDAIDKK